MNGHDAHQLPAVPAMTASRVLAMLQQNDWKLHHGNRVADRSPRRPRASPLAGSHKNDRTIKDERLQADRRGRVPAAGASNDHLSTARLANWFLALRGKSLGQAAPGSPKRRCSSGKRVVAKGGNWRYGSRVAVSPAADLGRSSNERRTSAKQYTGAFLLPAIYGNCARDTFGCAGPLSSRSANPRTAATILRLAANGSSSSTKGASPMMHHHAPNPSASHAAAWKARALAALRGNSSLSVRLRRYNQAMARARALEVQEVANA